MASVFLLNGRSDNNYNYSWCLFDEIFTCIMEKKRERRIFHGKNKNKAISNINRYRNGMEIYG